MDKKSGTIFSKVNEGIARHDGGILLATKRKGDWIETTVNEFNERVCHLCLGLYELGVREGDRVTLHSENSTEWLICDQALLSMGAVNVPIYTTQPAEQIKFIINNSGAVYHIFSKRAFYESIKDHIDDLGSLNGTISILCDEIDEVLGWNEVLEKGKKLYEEKPELFEELKSRVEPENLATLIYTSGTTGKPKGVMLTHNNITSNLEASIPRVPFSIEKSRQGHRMLSYLPLSHVFERLITYLYLHLGFPIYYIEDVEEIKKDFRHVKPFFFATVPRLLEKIYIGIKGKGQEFSGLQKQLYYWAINRVDAYDVENPPRGLNYLMHAVADKLVYSKLRQVFGGNLHGVISGGAALSPEIMRFMNAIGLFCAQGYGLSETSPVISVNDADNIRVGSSGKPLENVDVKIAENGEIRIKGPNVMKGYYRNDEKTKEAFDDEGYFKTGDVGHLDEDGYLFVTDRIKSMFKLSTGKYVAPQPIETELVNSPFIEQAVVIGYQHKFCSALVVPNFERLKKRLQKDNIELPDEHSLIVEREEVYDFLMEEINGINQEFSKWEQVKRIGLLEEQLSIENGELTPTMKVKRPVINKKYADKIEKIYEDE